MTPKIQSLLIGISQGIFIITFYEYCKACFKTAAQETNPKIKIAIIVITLITVGTVAIGQYLLYKSLPTQWWKT